MILTSCAVIYGGPNMDDRAKKLVLGMTKEDAVRIMGNNYFIEFSSQTPEEQIEVLHFRSISYNEYLLHFVNGELIEFHKYAAPTPIQNNVRVIKE